MSGPIFSIPLLKSRAGSLFFLSLLMFLLACQSNSERPVRPYPDQPFLQEHSIKYLPLEETELKKVFSDRNGATKVLSSAGLLVPSGGQFLSPGSLIPDRSYLHFEDSELRDLQTEGEQFYYLDEQAVLSNASGGSHFFPHKNPQSKTFCLGTKMDFLLAAEREAWFYRGNQLAWETELNHEILEIHYHPEQQAYYLLTAKQLYRFFPQALELEPLLPQGDFVSMTIRGDSILLAEPEGYTIFHVKVDKLNPNWSRNIPGIPISMTTCIDGHFWFGTDKGAFMLQEDGTYNYYYGKRWLADNKVRHISQGLDNSVLILTEKGLSQLVFQETTLAQKATFYEKQVRQRHIRFGFNADLTEMKDGLPETGRLKDSDNDGLWTGMYLASQAFRYAVTQSPEALANCRESLAAMERLFTINPVAGFPSRSFERHGYIDQLSDRQRWVPVGDSIWDWKSTTSSDEAIGHMFAYGVLAEIVEDEEIRSQAIQLMDTLMSHILQNDLYLVDYDGKPTTWGRWHPDYVNARLPMVGDRKLNSSNIIAMLQTAYHFTGKEKYRDKAFELIDKHGYLENLMRPMREIGPAPEEADNWDKMLSESWNHSDDEMYFLGYWGLYRYAFNDSLQQLYRTAIIDHWEAERPEKEALWNIMTAMTGIEDYDREETIWFLQEYPLDLINWDIQNSHRQDLVFLEPNFRGQTTDQVLPPDERPLQRHNGNTFNLDRMGGDGNSERSAGDIWLLPYWMGRYLGVIGGPVGRD